MNTKVSLRVAVALLLIMTFCGEALAKATAEKDPFSMVLQGMDAHRRLQFCGFVAKEAANQSGEASDAAARTERYAAAETLRSRINAYLSKSSVQLTSEELEAVESENFQALGLLSYAPSPRLASQVNSGNKNDVLGLFLGDVVAQCSSLLDKMGIAVAVPAAAKSTPMLIGFKWRGKTADEEFKATGLAAFANKICTGAESKISDFAGAKFDERGEDGVSLLDWAFECRDKSAFRSVLAAGFDAKEAGQFGDTPLIAASEVSDTWWLTELLAHGASPDTIGHRQTALSAAYEPLQKNGGVQFQLLRAAGASLNYPDPERSMWSTWSQFARWEEILDNWHEFKSDPVELGLSVSFELKNKPVRGKKSSLEQLKARLITDFGVCFPVVVGPQTTRDQSGYYVQPGCPRRYP